MFRKILALASASFVLALGASAQESCSTLDIQITPQPDQIYDTLTVKLDGSAPNRPTWIIGGISNQPQSIIYGPNLVLDVNVSVPILRGYLGLTNDVGTFEQSYNVPRNVDLTLYVQTVTLDFERMPTGLMNFDFCTSNTLTMLF